MSTTSMEESMWDLPPVNVTPLCWTTQCGTKIEVSKLSPKHKANIRKMLSRKKDFIEKWLNILK